LRSTTCGNVDVTLPLGCFRGAVTGVSVSPGSPPLSHTSCIPWRVPRRAHSRGQGRCPASNVPGSTGSRDVDQKLVHVDQASDRRTPRSNPAYLQDTGVFYHVRKAVRGLLNRANIRGLSRRGRFDMHTSRAARCESLPRLTARLRIEYAVPAGWDVPCEVCPLRPVQSRTRPAGSIQGHYQSCPSADIPI